MCVHFTPPPPKVLIQLALFDDLEYRPETYPKYKAPIIRKLGDETVASLAGLPIRPITPEPKPCMKSLVIGVHGQSVNSA
jgi:hypothetical protein